MSGSQYVYCASEGSCLPVQQLSPTELQLRFRALNRFPYLDQPVVQGACSSSSLSCTNSFHLYGKGTSVSECCAKRALAGRYFFG
jgi:hypothetical protein